MRSRSIVASGVAWVVAWVVVCALAAVASAQPAGQALRGPAVAGVVALIVVASTFGIDERRSSSGVFRTGIARITLNTQMVYHRDGKTATVDVIDADGFRLIFNNGGYAGQEVFHAHGHVLGGTPLGPMVTLR